MVTAINVWGVAWLVLTAQEVSNNRSEASGDETFGIDKVPFLFDISRLYRLSHFAESLHGLFPFLKFDAALRIGPKGNLIHESIG
jgi:hypothetical protein